MQKATVARNLNTFRDGWRVLRTLVRECAVRLPATAAVRDES